jgi:anti-sigma regulatory factor (Ser/Thr protein kinase)/Fe-S-cluster-containing hydrogenase component 2
MRKKNPVRTVSYSISGGDYANGGAASKGVKEMLKKIGVEPNTVRRTMIAAYEAEMNVVIHAYRGTMNVAANPELLDVVITDEGPGIPDIDLAMRDGYSTAPEAAREIGFGAGMGLAHIKKNSDRFSLQSTVGRGTRLRFSIFLRPDPSVVSDGHSVTVEASRCRQCLRCLHACPTAAVRVRDDKPEILGHLCVDCTACVESCDAGALYADGAREAPKPTRKTTLVLPGSFLEQFGPGVGPGQVLAVLANMGFSDVQLLDAWENALRAAVVKYAREETSARPVLSPVCPAVVNLVQVRFPSLLPNLAPFLSPIEAAREEVTGPHAVFLAVCPAHCTVLAKKSALTRIEVVRPSALREAVLKQVVVQARDPLHNGNTRRISDVVQVSGMRHVMKVLEAVENGEAPNFLVLELSACDQMCFGSPVWTEDPFLSRPRFEWERESHPRLLNKEAEAIRRVEQLEPRPGFRLDPDMGKAIEKLAAMDAWTRDLPGRDCGVCGAPACAALAEDIVLGRAKPKACVYRRPKKRIADDGSRRKNRD